MRNTLCEFLKLSRQSPRFRALHGLWLVARVHSLALVIAAVAKVSCKHGLWLVARVNYSMLLFTRFATSNYSITYFFMS